jgi:hypothetical protein
MKLKPKFDILVTFYLIFGSIVAASLFYVFGYVMGKKTEENYIRIFENRIQDTIKNIGYLSGGDYAYMHKGTIKTIELKNIKGVEFALYLENYKNIDNLMVGDYISKEENSSLISIKSKDKSFDIILKNIKEIRIHERKIEAIEWISGYLIIGLIGLFTPVKYRIYSNKK